MGSQWRTKPGRRAAGSQSHGLRRFSGSAGSQIVEFALALPFLLVMVIGVADFGAAHVLKDKLTNAAREGARVAIAQPTSDLFTQPLNPPSVEAVRDIVVNYLTTNGLSVSLSSTSPCQSAPYSWTYCLSNGGQIVIERGILVPVNVGGSIVNAVCTRVSVTNYPFNWSFARVIQLLVPGASYSDPLRLSTAVVMKNMT